MKRLNNNLIVLTIGIYFFLINSASAKIPEPSNIIHGTLYIGGTQILQSNSDFMVSCKPSSSNSNSGSGGGNTGTTPAPEFKLTNISIPETVSKSSEVVLFQFLSSNGKNHMVPSSGIIATNQNAGQINFTYNAPPQTGKHYYYFKVFNSAGQEIEQQFNITVVD